MQETEERFVRAAQLMWSGEREGYLIVAIICSRPKFGHGNKHSSVYLRHARRRIALCNGGHVREWGGEVR